MEKLLPVDDLVQTAHGRRLLQKDRLYSMWKAKARNLWTDLCFWREAVHDLQKRIMENQALGKMDLSS